MRDRFWLVLVLLTAAALRLIGLNNLSPPGLEHDEVANWLIDRAILGGQHAVYFTEAYGHEAGFHYFQTLFVALGGDNALTLRLPAALLGVLTVAVTYVLVRLLFGRDVALLAAALGAGVFWPVFHSRLALRSISLPFVAGLAATFWWRWWGTEARGSGGKSSQRPSVLAPPHLLLAGLLAGASAYTYMASRALPIFFALFFLYLSLFHRERFWRRWRGHLLFAAVYLAVALPLILYLRRVPDAEFRISEVDAPLRAFLAGDVRPALHNAWLIVQGFGWRGDPLWRQNVAGAAVFEPVTAALFYAGVLLALWRWREPRYAFLLFWTAAFATPSIMTVDAPSNIRLIGMLPAVFAFPAIAVTALGRLPLIHKMRKVIHSPELLSTVFPQLSTDFRKFSWIKLLTIGIFLFHSLRTADMVFRVWPQADEVKFVWQAALTEMAAYLDERPAIQQAAVAGWTPESMDAPTMTLTLRREDVVLRHFGGVGEVTTAVIPHPPAYVLRPTALPLNFYVEEELVRLTGEGQAHGAFTTYRAQEAMAVRPQVPASMDFGGELRFLGHERLLTPDLSSLEFITFWEVVAVPAAPRRFFLHMLDKNSGTLLAQHDGLDAAAPSLQPGDLLVQYHKLPQLNIPFELRLGVYNPSPPFIRLLTAAGEDHIILSDSPSSK